MSDSKKRLEEDREKIEKRHREKQRQQQEHLAEVFKELPFPDPDEGSFATRDSSPDSGEFAVAGTVRDQEDRKRYRGKLRKSIPVSAKTIFHQAFSIKEDTADYDTIRTRITSGGQVTGTNLSILLCAIVIASVGLNMNSTAVIIGAMLISPLMGTIQLMGLSIATADSQKFKRSIIGFLFQVITALLGSSVYFLLTPIKVATSELLARTQPTVWDVLIATAGGLAGAIATTRKEATSNVIPGVAIATALMPPLCTCGYSIATAHWSMLLGAGFLFTINMFFILVANVLVLYVLEVPEVSDAQPGMKQRMRKNLIRNAILILIPSIIMASYVTHNTNTKEKAQKVAPQSATAQSSVSPSSLERQMNILFPEVEDIRFGTVEQENREGDVEEQKMILITVSEPLSQEDEQRLERWVSDIEHSQYQYEFQVKESAS